MGQPVEYYGNTYRYRWVDVPDTLPPTSDPRLLRLNDTVIWLDTIFQTKINVISDSNLSITYSYTDKALSNVIDQNYNKPINDLIRQKFRIFQAEFLWPGRIPVTVDNYTAAYGYDDWPLFTNTSVFRDTVGNEDHAAIRNYASGPRESTFFSQNGRQFIKVIDQLNHDTYDVGSNQWTVIGPYRYTVDGAVFVGYSTSF
jgi:hypothetical protein